MSTLISRRDGVVDCGYSASSSDGTNHPIAVATDGVETMCRDSARRKPVPSPDAPASERGPSARNSKPGGTA
jgi:hypothetical protein